MTTEQKRRGALEALDRVLNRGGDADDVLREILVVLSGLFPYVGVTFVEDGELVAGPSLGSREEDVSTFPVEFNGVRVGALEASPPVQAEDRPFLERVALLISPYCLVGWDTGGERWTP